MLNVFHLVDEFLPLSQTFIYQYLTKMEQTRPIVLTHKRVNSDLFAFEDVINLNTLPKLKWFSERIFFRTGVELFASSRRTISKLKQFDAQIIHAHFGHVGYRALTFKHRLNLPLITTFYGFDMSILPKRLPWKKAYKTLFTHGDYFLVEGEKMGEALKSMGCPADKIIIQPIAIDITKIPFKPYGERAGQDDSTPIRILMAGRFIEKKGFKYGIEAFAKISPQWPQVELNIIGAGPLQEEMETAIKRSGCQEKINLLGMQPYEAYLDEMGRSHLFLSPSVTAQNGDTEGGAPTTLLEAQAAGLPVISSWHADIPNVVLHEKTGFLAAERNVSQLVEHLSFLLKRRDQWDTIGATGRAFIDSNHNIAQEAKKLESLYADLSLMPPSAL